MFCKKINKSNTKKSKKWVVTDKMKIKYLQVSQNKSNIFKNKPTKKNYPQFSNYNVSTEEKQTLSISLEGNISTRINNNTV